MAIWLAQRFDRHVADVAAVDQDATGDGIEEARQQIGQRRFAGAARPDQRHDLAGIHGELDVGQRRLVFVLRIAERNIVDDDRTHERRQFAGVRRLVDVVRVRQVFEDALR